MNREEAMKIIKSNRPIYRDWQEEFDEALERLQRPLTLAEFLGWEEDTEYKIERNSLVYKVTNDTLWLFNEYGKLQSTSSLDMDSTNIRKLRSAKKVEPKKYYAKIKGWELIENSKVIYWDVDNEEWELAENSKLTHWNVDSEERDVFIGTDSHDSRYQTSLTIKEWNELGITDENADFEEAGA